MKQIKCLNNFGVALQKPKRFKIFVGGRASTKTTFVADVCLSRIRSGKIWCCAREYLNSIEESVHRTLMDEGQRLEVEGLFEKNNMACHTSGGRAFHRGLARNITSLKGMLAGVDVLWIEEGEAVTENTLRVLTASLRTSALDAERVLEGEIDIEDMEWPEVWITMNRRSREDAISKKFLARAETELQRCGFYEDDVCMVIQANYTDMPKEWWELTGLESERQDDLTNMSAAEYRHKWHGDYLEYVENALIKLEWFEACVDAHVKLGIKPTGARITAFDPASTGEDAKGYSHRKGILFEDVGEIAIGDGNDALDECLDQAKFRGCDLFVWDADGMGALLRKQVGDAFKGTGTKIRAYMGSNSPDNPLRVYEGLFAPEIDAEDPRRKNVKKNKDMFSNKRAQYYTKLAQAMYNTYRAVVKKEYVDPDSLISISSKIKLLDKLRAEICHIPRVPNGAGKIQLMKKEDMKQKLKMNSPNMADTLAMSMEDPASASKPTKIEYKSW